MEICYVPHSPDEFRSIPFDFRASRGIKIGDWLFTGGQLDITDDFVSLNQGDRWQQAASSMRRLYEVIARANASIDDVAQLHVFFRGKNDEADFSGQAP